MHVYETIYEKISIDINTCIELLHHKNDLMILNSAKMMAKEAHFSFLCFDAFSTFIAKKHQYFWNGNKIALENPFVFLKAKFDEYKIKKNPLLPPLQGGAIGYLGYEANHYLEVLPEVADEVQLPDIFFNFYSTVVAFDHQQESAWIIATGFPEKNQSLRIQKANDSITEIKSLLMKVSPKNQKKFKHKQHKITSNFSKNEYHDAVRKSKEYILSGDIFQVNLTQQFKTKLENTSFLDLYLKLMYSNPAPFSALINIPQHGCIISASPERFVKLTDHLVETCPIKGTQKRSKDPNEDQALATSLLDSQKDHAENVMIVDLMRNDLSRVCKANSVQVEELCTLKSFTSVHHLVSKITAKLKNHFDAIDLLQATFPPGSVTGAPKIRAMEIISALEKKTRGPYCGCIGYLSFTGDMDTAVTIRSYYINQDNIFFSAGGAIVLDSNAANEYQESLLKAKTLIETLTK